MWKVSFPEENEFDPESGSSQGFFIVFSQGDFPHQVETCTEMSTEERSTSIKWN